MYVNKNLNNIYILDFNKGDKFHKEIVNRYVNTLSTRSNPDKSQYK